MVKLAMVVSGENDNLFSVLPQCIKILNICISRSWSIMLICSCLDHEVSVSGLIISILSMYLGWYSKSLVQADQNALETPTMICSFASFNRISTAYLWIVQNSIFLNLSLRWIAAPLNLIWHKDSCKLLVLQTFWKSCNSELYKSFTMGVKVKVFSAGCSTRRDSLWGWCSSLLYKAEEPVLSKEVCMVGKL